MSGRIIGRRCRCGRASSLNLSRFAERDSNGASNHNAWPLNHALFRDGALGLSLRPRARRWWSRACTAPCWIAPRSRQAQTSTDSCPPQSGNATLDTAGPLRTMAATASCSAARPMYAAWSPSYRSIRRGRWLAPTRHHLRPRSGGDQHGSHKRPRVVQITMARGRQVAGCRVQMIQVLHAARSLPVVARLDQSEYLPGAVKPPVRAATRCCRSLLYPFTT